MKINLDTINAALAPAPLILTLDGRDYEVRDLPVAETLLLDTLGTLDDEDIGQQIDFLKSLFVKETPAILDQLLETAAQQNDLREAALKAVGDKPLREMRERDVKAAQDLGSYDPARFPKPGSPPNGYEALLLLKGKLPGSLAEMTRIEHEYFLLSQRVIVIIAAIRAHMLEGQSLGKLKKTAMQMISQQIDAQRSESASPA
jgi:hypothetical protein